MGWCIQFDATNLPKVSNVGVDDGLNMRLAVHQDEYLAPNSPGAGYRILVHEKDEIPLMIEQSLSIGPGQIYSMEATKKSISALPSPYGTCQDDITYKRRYCLLHCLSQFVVKSCKCRQIYMTTNASVCSPIGILCAERAVDKFMETELHKDCACKSECKTVQYEVFTTHARASTFYAQAIAEYHKISERELFDNYCTVVIFFSKLTTMDSKEHPAYNVLALFCDIGGAFGLMLGATILTIFELSDAFMKTIILWVRQRKHKVKPLRITEMLKLESTKS
ncbi:DgyrCDS807 [Dimorphilus gyrociliatus]|nr:DgyrCDS807 [Dimorphilus gyrociliatus]